MLLEPLNVPDELIETLAEPIQELGHRFVYHKTRTTDPQELARRTHEAHIVIIGNTPYPKEAFERAENLELISVAFTGTDHIDEQAAETLGIKIINAAGYSDQSVAELVIGLILDVYRCIAVGNESIRSESVVEPIQGRELRGRTVGIIGTGRIGLKTAELLRAFGVDLIAYSRTQKDEAKELGIRYVELDDLLTQSDIVTLHVPHNDQTYHLLSKDKLQLMSKDAILINCARGPIVDNTALAELLNQKKIAGAGIDVFDMEPPLPSDYPLLTARNATLTPHVAYLTDEAMVNRANIVFNKVINYLKKNDEKC